MTPSPSVPTRDLKAADPGEVLIVGLGPTGAVLAHLLGRAGIRVHALEREPTVFAKPRAVFFDDEIMRVLQTLGLADRIGGCVHPVEGMDFVDAAGDLLYRYRARPGPGPLGWEEGFMFLQPELEAILRESLASLPTVTVTWGAQVHRIDLEPDAAIVHAVGPEGEPMVWQARHVVGCDGARSTVRRAMGASLVDLEADAPWIVVDLTLRGAPSLPPVTVQYCDPARPATFVPLPGNRCRFEIMVLPGEDPEGFTEPDALARLLSPWIARDDYAVDRAAAYTFHAVIAERWREGPLMIAGDAAHQMPPFLGQGMCSGIRDASALAWKLAMVCRGSASPTLLDTYGPERASHTRRIIDLDLELGALIQATDPAVAAARDAHARSQPGALDLQAPRLVTDLALPVGHGASVGLPFPQPRTADGRLHDERLGDGFALVGSLDISSRGRHLLDRLGAIHLDAPAPVLRDWLRTLGADAVLVRPDRLVMAELRSSTELDALATHLFDTWLEDAG